MYAALDMPESREVTEQIDPQAKITSGLHLGRSGVLRSLRPYMLNQGPPLICWWRETYKQEALDDLPSKGCHQ